MNNITMALNADELILSALREDITSEDITTNSNCLTAKQKLLLQKKTEIP